MAFNPLRAIKVLFSSGNYDATVNRKRRTAPRCVSESEDNALNATDRKKLVSTARQQRRNQTLLAWMIRQHLDFVAKFTFQPRTGIDELDEKLEDLMAWRSRKNNWDVAERHDRDSFLRLMESSRVVDGDVGAILVKGGKLQAIEGDRITWPSKGLPPKSHKKADWTHGVKLKNNGATQSYMICSRDGEGTVYNKTVSARNMFLLAYYDRFDQVRGVSPLSSALTTLQDQYEALVFTKAKIKMHAMLGIMINRAPSTTGGDGFEYTDADGGDVDSDTSSYDFELRDGLKIEGAPGDSAQMLESRTPSDEFQNFNDFLTQIAILALDIPATYYDSRRSSYVASRQDVQRYSKSVKRKQEALKQFLDLVTAWDISRWTSEGPNGEPPLIKLPAGMLARDVKWSWIADGIPWLDPMKEVQANLLAVSAGFTTRDTVCREVYGTRFKDTCVELGKEEACAIENGATLAIGQPGQITTRDEEAGNTANDTGAE